MWNRELPDDIFQLICCPLTGESLSYYEMNTNEISMPLIFQNSTCLNFKTGVINGSQTYLYPIIRDVFMLHPVYAIPLAENSFPIQALSFDKERVFRYYNEIEYQDFDESTIYADSFRFLNYREVTKDYLRNSFQRVRQYIRPGGRYFLDIASGPIGLQEYLSLSEDYDYRICIDISYRALLQAKKNLSSQKGIFICGDMTSIPLMAGVCDVAVSQHTLYHLPKNEQENAIKELYRVTKKGGQLVIVYSWFYKSILMSGCLFPIQVYRVVRHYLGKLYVRLIQGKPRLYFYAFGPVWFKSLNFEEPIEIYCWRSLDKYFLKIFIHKRFFGKRILNFVQKLEATYPKTMGIIGAYALIRIQKRQ